MSDFWKIIEPKQTLSADRCRFSNDELKKLILPLLAEQFLTMLIGIVDTLMISYVGEEALSGVSLVNQLNNLFIFVFGALASGGAIVASQYIGKNDSRNSNLAAGQLIMITTLTSMLPAVLLSVFSTPVLRFFFPMTEKRVFDAASIYLIITAFSFPFLALYNSCSALFRSMKRTDVIMKISVAMNLINAAGNALGVFVFKAGVWGVAIPSLLSRAFAGIVLFVMLRRHGNVIRAEWRLICAFNKKMLARIMKIAVPSAVSSALFNGAKVLISSVVSGFATAQIAAYGIAQDFWSMGSLFCSSMGNAFVVVVGQCMGAGDVEAGDYYMKKLLKLTLLGSTVWNLVIIAVTPLVLQTYDITAETYRYVIAIVTLHNLFNAVLWPIASALPNGLRASGDIRYIMFVSVFSTVVCRLLFTYLFGVWLGWGVVGVVVAMIADWSIKAAFVLARYRSGKWKEYRVI